MCRRKYIRWSHQVCCRDLGDYSSSGCPGCLLIDFPADRQKGGIEAVDGSRRGGRIVAVGEPGRDAADALCWTGASDADVAYQAEDLAVAGGEGANHL